MKLALFGFVLNRRRNLKILIFTCHKRAYVKFALRQIGFVFSNSFRTTHHAVHITNKLGLFCIKRVNYTLCFLPIATKTRIFTSIFYISYSILDIL